jgi:hypothetical protein
MEQLELLVFLQEQSRQDQSFRGTVDLTLRSDNVDPGADNYPLI